MALTGFRMMPYTQNNREPGNISLTGLACSMLIESCNSNKFQYNKSIAVHN